MATFQKMKTSNQFQSIAACVNLNSVSAIYIYFIQNVRVDLSMLAASIQQEERVSLGAMVEVHLNSH